MEFADFARLVVEHLDLEHEGPWYPWTGLYDDLGVDSFQAFQLILVLEAAAGLDLGPDELPPIYTLGDAYEYYRSAQAMAAAS
jgi:acyl carrier protein